MHRKPKGGCKKRLAYEKLEVVAIAYSPDKAADEGGDCLNFANS